MEKYTQKQLWHMAKCYFEAKEFGSSRCEELIYVLHCRTGLSKDQIEYQLQGIVDKGE